MAAINKDDFGSAAADDAVGGGEDAYDEARVFIDMDSAVEVGGDDTMMEDDDDGHDGGGMMAEMPADGGGNEAPPLSSTAQTTSAPTTAAAIDDRSNATFRSHADSVYAVASHLDASTGTLSIASGGGDDRAYLHVVGPTSGTMTIPLSHPHSDSVSCAAFNMPYITSDVSGKVQQNLLAVGSYDGSVVLYDPPSPTTGQQRQPGGGVGEPLCPLRVLEGPTDVEFLSFHPRGGTVLLAGSVADGTVWMFHAPTGRCMQVFVGHEGGVVAGDFAPDGKTAVSAGRDGTVRIWAPKTGMSKHVFRLMENGGGGGEEGPGLTCLVLGGGSDGQLAICGGEDGNAYVVHLSGKKLLATLHHFEESPPSPNDNNKVNAGDDGMEEDDDEGEMEARSVEAVGFCPPAIPGTGGWCATGGVDGILKVWNMGVAGGSGGGAQLRQRCTRGADAEGAGITRLRWHATLPLIVCAYTDGAVGIWDARTGALTATLTGHGDMINDMSVAFAADNSAVISTGSDDNTVKVFEFRP